MSSVRKPLTREQVVDVAFRLVEKDGIDALSFRSLAARLGTTPMALYRHVSNREDLLTEVLDRYLDREPLPGEQDPAEWILTYARDMRRFLLRHRWAIPLYIARPIVTPCALERMEAALTKLSQGDMEITRAAEIYGLTITFVIGFVGVESGRSERQGNSQYWVEFFSEVPEERYPRLSELAPNARNFIDASGFERGLKALLSGLIESGRGR